MFENLLISFPKRIDLWNVFLAQEILTASPEQVRKLFIKITRSHLKPKNAKYFYKKWLDYEEKKGDQKNIDDVKARGGEFIRNRV